MGKQSVRFLSGNIKKSRRKKANKILTAKEKNLPNYNKIEVNVFQALRNYFWITQN